MSGQNDKARNQLALTGDVCPLFELALSLTVLFWYISSLKDGDPAVIFVSILVVLDLLSDLLKVLHVFYSNILI